MKHCFIVAGEKSGDIQGLPVVEALQKTYPQALFEGIGGPFLQKAGLQLLIPFSAFQVMGFTDVIRSFPRLYRHFRKILHHILTSQPDLVLLIDYPGFNLRLAQSLRRKGYKGKIVQYICPKVWAWGKGRIPKMARDLDLLLTLFPFEPEIFQETGLPCRYVGNPLVRAIKEHEYDSDWRQKAKIPAKVPLISLFPGSRRGEIERNFPPMLEAAANHSALFAFSCADPSLLPFMRDLFSRSPLASRQAPHYVPHDFRYELMRESHFAIATAGTVNVELALHSTPTIVTYVLTRLNKWMAKYILRLRLPHYSMVNILLQKEAFPELITKGCTAPQISEAMKQLNITHSKTDCIELQKILDDKESGKEALQAIQEIL